jgi:hypothetical protein
MSLCQIIDNEILFESIQTGLGDRMLSFIGFIVFCQTIHATPIIHFNKRKLVCDWGSNEYDIKNFTFDFELGFYNEKKRYYRTIENHTSIVLSPLKLYKFLKQKKNIDINYVDFSSKYKQIASKIKPSIDMEQYIPNLANVYGIHLRRTDKVKPNREIEHENSIEEFNSIINNLVIDLVAFINIEEAASFLVVGEDENWNSEFKRSLESKCNRKIHFVNILYPKNEITKGFNVVLDMFCLSRCKRIYQSVKWSSFSSLAALIGNVDIINYYHILPEQECNFIYTWKSILNINGKIDNHEYENIGDRLGDIKINYMNTNNIFF